MNKRKNILSIFFEWRTHDAWLLLYSSKYCCCFFQLLFYIITYYYIYKGNNEWRQSLHERWKEKIILCVCVCSSRKFHHGVFVFIALDVDDVVVFFFFFWNHRPANSNSSSLSSFNKVLFIYSKKKKLLFKHFQHSEFSEKNHKTSLFEIYDEINRICANKTIMIIYKNDNDDKNLDFFFFLKNKIHMSVAY